jgi:hypothetical protein
MVTSPKGLGPERGYLARANSIYERQTRPLVRGGAPQKQDCNCQRINIWSWAPDRARHQDLLINWPSVAMWLWLEIFSSLRGDGFEYFHRIPASRRRRRKGNHARGYNQATVFLGDINTGTWRSRLRESRIWDSKIWSQVLRDPDPRMTALAKTSSNYKWQTCSLVRESAPHQQTRNCLTDIKNLVISPR